MFLAGKVDALNFSLTEGDGSFVKTACNRTKYESKYSNYRQILVPEVSLQILFDFRAS